METLSYQLVENFKIIHKAMSMSDVPKEKHHRLTKYEVTMLVFEDEDQPRQFTLFI